MDDKDQNVMAYIALGANLPHGESDLSATLTAAIDELSAYVTIFAKSRTFHTPCFPAGSGPDYLNAAIAVEWPGESSDLLAVLHGVEHRFGRLRGARWAARSLDLDLIAHGARITPDVPGFTVWADLSMDEQMTRTPDQLIVPHPRIQDRAFVLGPMMDIAPDWNHPVYDLTTRQMWTALPAADRGAIRPV